MKSGRQERLALVGCEVVNEARRGAEGSTQQRSEDFLQNDDSSTII